MGSSYFSVSPYWVDAEGARQEGKARETGAEAILVAEGLFQGKA